MGTPWRHSTSHEHITHTSHAGQQQQLTEATAPGAAAKTAMTAEMKRSFILLLLRYLVFDVVSFALQKLWQHVWRGGEPEAEETIIGTVHGNR